jgi:transposase-like protein
MGIEKSVRRKRKHAEEFKRAVVDACWQTGSSISEIALANDINPNLAHRWMREQGVTRSSAAPKATVAVAEPAFLPIQIAPAISEGRNDQLPPRIVKNLETNFIFTNLPVVCATREFMAF